MARPDARRTARAAAARDVVIGGGAGALCLPARGFAGLRLYRGGGQPSFDNFAKAFDLYGGNIAFNPVIVGVSTVLIGLIAAAIGGSLVLGAHPVALAVL